MCCDGLPWPLTLSSRDPQPWVVVTVFSPLHSFKVSCGCACARECIHLHMYACTCMYAIPHIQRSVDNWGVGSLLLSCGFQRTSLSSQAWQQKPLPPEPCHCPWAAAVWSGSPQNSRVIPPLLLSHSLTYIQNCEN